MSARRQRLTTGRCATFGIMSEPKASVRTAPLLHCTSKALRGCRGRCLAPREAKPFVCWGGSLAERFDLTLVGRDHFARRCSVQPRSWPPLPTWSWPTPCYPWTQWKRTIGPPGAHACPDACVGRTPSLPPLVPLLAARCERAAQNVLRACMLPCPCCREEEDHEEELAHREDLASAGSTDLTAVLRGETRLTQASWVAFGCPTVVLRGSYLLVWLNRLDTDSPVRSPSRCQHPMLLAQCCTLAPAPLPCLSHPLAALRRPQPTWPQQSSARASWRCQSALRLVCVCVCVRARVCVCVCVSGGWVGGWGLLVLGAGWGVGGWWRDRPCCLHQRGVSQRQACSLTCSCPACLPAWTLLPCTASAAAPPSSWPTPCLLLTSFCFCCTPAGLSPRWASCWACSCWASCLCSPSSLSTRSCGAPAAPVHPLPALIGTGALLLLDAPSLQSSDEVYLVLVLVCQTACTGRAVQR